VLLLGDALLQQGEDQRVIALLEPRASDFQEDLAFGYLLGTALVRTGQRDRGQIYMDRIFRAGESAEARLLMGTALLQTKDYPGAVVELRKAVELNPQLPTVRTMYGRALMAVGDPEAAAREFLRALQANPNDFEANLQLGALRKRDQQNEDARVYLERAVRLRPADPTARFGLAGVEMALNRNDVARTLLERLVADVPGYEEAHVMLATCYYRLKQREKGEQHSAIAERLRLERQERQATPGQPPAEQAAPPSERP
jgi:tetratricopeptide (TPR) repeat protein